MKIEKIIGQLIEADQAYYNSKPLVSDAAYDTLRCKAFKTVPDHPYFKRIGAPIPGKEKAKHKIAMGSLANILNFNEFKKWVKSLPTGAICLQWKLDGLSIELIYEDGHLIQAVTRGDGIQGEDVTKNALKSKYLPLVIDKTIRSVRCEALLSTIDWKSRFPNTENARNTAAGLMRRSSGEGAEHLNFVAFDATSFDGYKTEVEKLTTLHLSGFIIPGWSLHSSVDLWEAFEELEKKREGFPYEIDGFVAKLNNIESSEKLGSVSNRPRAQRALKFVPKGATTLLRNVVWQVGSQGTLCPVGKVKPIKVGGTTIRSVTLCNLEEINRLGLAIGDTVTVIRAADVIPKITERVKKGKGRLEIKAPMHCPSCHSPSIKQKGANLYCLSLDCSARRFQQIMNWIKKRNILYLGEGILEAAWNYLQVRDIEDIYKLNIKDWSELLVGNGNLGDARAQKLHDELFKSREVVLYEFLGSLSIKGVGRSLMKQLCETLEVHTLKDFWEKVEDENAAHWINLNIEGFKETRTDAMLTWLKQNRKRVDKLGKFLEFTQPNKQKQDDVLSGEVVCFTGNAEVKRATLQKLVISNGGEFKTSVTKGTTILVIADPESTSSKACKARSAGIRLMSPVAFLDMVDYTG